MVARTDGKTLPGQQTLPGQPTPLEKAQKLAEDATNKVAQQGQGFYYRDTPGQYVGSALSPSQKVILDDEQFDSEIQRILGDESIRKDLAVDLYRDRSIYNAAGMETDSTVANGLLNSVAKYKASEDSGKVSYLDWLADRASRGRPAPGEDGGNGGGGGSSRGGGGYSGPTSSVTLMNERDLRSTADAVASTVVGRGISDDEFKKILKKVRTAERANPSISTPGVGSNVTQQGLSAEGRQDIIREALMKGPEAEDYSKATTMMNIFNQALESRPEGA